MAYSDKVIEHYENPRNVGTFAKEEDDVGTGLVGAPACGDVMRLQIKVKDGRIADAKFKTFGCGSAIASKEFDVKQAAAEENKGQRDNRGAPEACIRVGVHGGGCTGFTYVFEWADQIRPTDTEFKAEGTEVGIVVDPKSLVFLGGMTL